MVGFADSFGSSIRFDWARMHFLSQHHVDIVGAW